MDLENDGAAGTAAVWATVSPPQIPLVDGFSFHQAPLPCTAAGSAENNEWGGGLMGEWAGGKCSEKEWGLENGGDSWGAMGEEGMIVEGAAEAPPTPLIQAIARKNISASADVSTNNTATVATCVTNGWDPLHLNLQPQENVQGNPQEKPRWQVGHGNDGSCLSTSPSAATSAGGGCASRRSLGGVTPSAATSAYAAGASFGPANAAPAIPLLTLPPSASFTGPPPSAAAAHGTGTKTTECGGHVPAAWFTPTATSATNVSPASLMSALGSLQGKIAALQLLIPLVAQSGPEPAVREQQEAAAVGVAAVIQQVALAAVGLLPPRLQAQLLLPDIAGVVRAEQMRAEQEQSAQKYAELGNADQSAEKRQVEAEAQGQAEAEGVQQQPHMQEAMMMALAQALQLQDQQQQEQQQHEQKLLALPTAPSPPLPPAVAMFAPDAGSPSAAPPPAPLAPADPLAGPAAAPLLPHPPPPLSSPVSVAASGAGASTVKDDAEAGEEGVDKEGEQGRAGGSKRGREYDCEMEAAMGGGPLKQAKMAESQAADASGEEAAPTITFPTASRSASGTASEAAAAAASGGESMGEGCDGSKADTATVTATASASDSDGEAAGGSSGGGAGWGAEGVRVGEWMVVELRVSELTNDQMHFCDTCGKGFKREANLRMHIKAHGRVTPNHPAASPPPFSSFPSPPVDPAQCRFSCPVAGCKRHREHAAFQPLKTVLCVRNHYRRSHCPKLLACSRCGGAKRFAVLADLRTHEKHCGLTSWTCSCGSRFSRKDKLMAHLVTFIGHSAVSPGNNRA